MADADDSAAVKVRVIGVTDVGRVREHNEDSFLVMDRDTGKRFATGEQVDVADVQSAMVMAVCDGMGGAAAGEVASRMAAERVAETLGKADLKSASPDQIAALMDQAVQQANSEILALAKADQEKKGMGTTLTGAVAVRGRLFVSQVGDSRAYLLRNGQLNQITKDQSLIGQLIEEGTLTEEEAEKYGARNIVLQAVGVEETLRVDTKHWPLLRGDVILICSDGLSGMVKDARMKAILQEHGEDLRTAADRLVLEANDNGGRDNVTVILARFDGEGLRAPMETSGGSAADGTMEKAGAEFKAPPPPDVPNPMKKVATFGLAALGLVIALFYVFRPTTAHVAFQASPAMHVTIRNAADKSVVKEVDVTTPEASIEVGFGDYLFTATAPKHFDENRTFKVESSGNVPFDPVELVPKPVTLVVRAEDRDVEYTVDVKSPHKKKLQDFHDQNTLPTPGVPRTTGNVPAGPMTLVAKRAGFREHKVEKQLEPDSTETVVIPKLTEITGELVLVAPAGAELEIELLTQSGESLGTFRVSQAAPFRRQVRVGEITVAATSTVRAPFRREVKVEEGKSITVPIDAPLLSRAVKFSFTPNAELHIAQKQPDGSWKDLASSIFFNEAGHSRRDRNLTPGEYRLRSTDGKKSQQRTIEAGTGPVEWKVELQ